jgi:predicted ArsR family transcriptional regulator
MEEAKPKIKHQILYLLKQRGEQTATALAEQLEVSPMAIRQHLQSLKAEGLVSYREDRRPLGRPVKLWHLTERSISYFPDSHADLMLDLMRGVEAVFGQEGLTKLLADRAARQIQAYQSRLLQMDAHHWQSRVRAIAQLRTQEGYMAEVIEQADGLLLVENHCPICTAAQTCVGLCVAELEVFRAVLGEGVTVERVEHLLDGDRRCAYLVRV